MNIEEFIKNFADQFDETEPELIKAGTIFHDLDEWDSLIALAVLNMCEKKYGKKLTFDDMKACVTIENLFKVVESK